MRRNGWLLCALLAGTCLAGCKTSSGHAYPDDPLFVSKKPIEAKAETAPPTRVASADPVAPTLPFALAARPRSPGNPLDDSAKQSPVVAPRGVTQAVSEETATP